MSIAPSLLNHTYKTRVVSASCVLGSDGSRMLFIKMKKPILFQFKPGQYAHLKHSPIDQQWHPFSIASDPWSRFLEFYIEVLGPETWTGRLWDLLKDKGDDGLTNNRVEVDVMGPSEQVWAKWRIGLLIGAGTGEIRNTSTKTRDLGNYWH